MARVKTATRAVTNAGQLRTLVVVAGKKGLGALPAESLVEYDGLLELLADPDIVSIQVQPKTLTVLTSRGEQDYTPDVEYVRRDGTIGYREFKLSAKLPPDIAEKLDAAAELLAKQGYEFAVRTADVMRADCTIANLRLLKRYQSWPTEFGFTELVQNHVSEHDEVTLEDLRRHFGDDRYGSICRMLWDQTLLADISSQRLSGKTRVFKGVF